MGLLIDLSQKKYGRLTVKSMVRREGFVRPHWLCLCDCGNETVVAGMDLRNGHTQSCGCLRLEAVSGENSHLYTNGLHAAEFKRQVKGALKRDLVFDLTSEEVKTFFDSNCSYCEAEPKEDNRGLIRNGIDRLDSQEGYNMDNCVPCCGTCNMMKRAMNAADFRTQIRKIAKVLNKKGI